MPGYLMHIDCAPEIIRNSKVGLKGIIAPDLWKSHTPTQEEYSSFFANCIDVPRYEEILMLCNSSHGGTHFGSPSYYTSRTNFSMIRNLFLSGKLDSSNIFFTGFMHHLYVDNAFYSDKNLFDSDKFFADYLQNPVLAKQTLHNDWDAINLHLATMNPELISVLDFMPDEVKAFVKFSSSKTTYASFFIFDFMQEMRKKAVLTELIGL